jgi:hypothetical protein
MRFYTKQHQFYGGIALHARPMDRCLWNQAGEMLVPRHMPAAPAPCLTTIAPSREDVVVGGEWTLHLGPGWLISGLKRGFPSCWVMPCT